MNRKLVLGITLIAAMVFSVCAQQPDPESDFLVVPAAGLESVMVIGYTGNNRIVRIPPEIHGLPVTHIGEGAFAGDQFTSVTIPSSVVSIGSGAFANNENLQTVNFASGSRLERIYGPSWNEQSMSWNGFGAFQNTGLREIAIPNSITSIENLTFLNTRLASVTIPNSVTHIGVLAFAGSQLTGVIIPNSVDRIEDAAFAGNQLTRVTIGNRVTHIGYSAFLNNQITSLEIPNSVEYIGFSAFRNNQLTSLDLGNSITHTGNNAFLNNRLTSVTIPDSVTFIGFGSFQANQLTSVTIPNSVVTIGSGAFANNETLQTVNFAPGSRLERINGPPWDAQTQRWNGVGVFQGTGIREISIPNSVISIGDKTFHGSQLTRINIPGNVTSIGRAAFLNTQLTSIIIPDSVTHIETWAFLMNTITSITFESAETILGSDFINNEGNLRALYSNGGAGTFTRPNANSSNWVRLQDFFI